MLYRPLTVTEMRSLAGTHPGVGFLVARIVDRAELEKAVRSL
jgi:hypothetical protein